MQIEGFCQIEAGTSQQGTLLLEAETLLPFTKRMTGQGEHFKRTGDGAGVALAFGYSQALLSSIKRFAELTLVPVELGDIIEHMGILGSLCVLVYLSQRST